MYENCDRFKFHDVRLTNVLGFNLYPVFLQMITKHLHFSYMEGVLIRKQMNFGQLECASAAMLFANNRLQRFLVI